MAEDRYPKEDILNVPYLAPERDYRSEGNSEEHINYPAPDKPDRTLETLDNLDGVIRMADLLPAELGAIIKDITNVLSVDTQGKIIIDLMNPVPTTPETTEPGKPESGGGTYIHTPGDGDKNDGDYIDDIFSSEPEFTIQVDSPDSLITLARRAYKQDDLDIKEHYTSRMTQLSARFYQVMSTLAVDANMPDYSYLMQDFDGTAVTTSDPNQQHLIDNICKNQILYDQKLRQMNLIHTAENTLIMTRAMTAAEGQRERYLSEKYKKNLDDIPSSLSNSLLEKSREEANKKYKDSAYNMYKYLDSATKFTNSLLNLKIDNAAAKAQLANTGSDIYAVTPPPAPTPDNVDDNYDTVVKQQQAGDKFVKDQSKDSKKASELDNGIDSGGSGSSGGGNKGYHGLCQGGTGLDVLAPHPNPPGEGVERWSKYVYDAIMANGETPNDERVARILRQIDTESSGDPGVTQQIQDINSANGNPAQGLMQMIPSTFEANKIEGHDDIMNGYDNLLSAVHYIIAAYGIDSDFIGAGHGY